MRAARRDWLGEVGTGRTDGPAADGRLLKDIGVGRRVSPHQISLPPPSRHAAGTESLLQSKSNMWLGVLLLCLILCVQAAVRRLRQTAASSQVGRWQQQRGLATPSEPYDAIIIGGGELVNERCVSRLSPTCARSRWLRGCD